MAWKKWRWKDRYLKSLGLVIHPGSDVTPQKPFWLVLVSADQLLSVRQQIHGDFFSFSWKYQVWVFVNPVMLWILGSLLTGLNLALYIAARDTVLLALSVSNAPLYFPFLFWF